MSHNQTAIQDTAQDPFIVAAKMMALKTGSPIEVTRDPHTGNYKVRHTTAGMFTFIMANKLHGKSQRAKLERFCAILVRVIGALEAAVQDPKAASRSIIMPAANGRIVS